MHLREGERILKVFHHHITPFVGQVLIAIVSTLPFYLLLFALQGSVSGLAYFISHIIVFLIFALMISYMTLVFWLDRLVVTNMRVIYINWKTLTIREEAEAFWEEIQDIHTKEKGVFSYFKFLDYGMIAIQTAATFGRIEFDYAPDPEGIRQFIFHVRNQ
ncbi:MAG: PH domain-containing protein [Patescibacteria group bacterium]